MTAHSILIVDDVRSLPAVLTPKLQGFGYVVRSASSIDEALADVRRDPPTFILADRNLDEPIEVRNLGRLCDAAPTSMVLVYTGQELTNEQEHTILSRGAYRVLDKAAIGQLINDIRVLVQDFDELLELSSQLEEATTERSRIVAALVGTGVAVSVVDRNYRRWFQYASEGVGGGVCRNSCFATIPPGTPEPCRGCTVADVLRTKRRIDRTALRQSGNHGFTWVAVQSTPIFSNSGDSIIAVREAVDRLGPLTVAAIPLKSRLQYIAEAFVASGFGRARIYRSIAPNRVRLVAAAAYSDGPDIERRPYFDSVTEVTMDIDACPYAWRAFSARIGGMTEAWTDNDGPSPHTASLGLQPPYIDLPVWLPDGALGGWIGLDFVGLADRLRQATIQRLALREGLTPLGDSYAYEVAAALEAGVGRSEDRARFEIVERAKLAFAAATSVDAAITCIREAFKALLPKCRVSVRSRKDDTLREFPSLCWGQPEADTPTGSPSVIALDDARSLAAGVVHSQRPLWIADYDDYVNEAERANEPIGYAPLGTKSSAQIPLRFESTAFGTVSINSPDYLDWENDGYKGLLLALAENTALVLRDLALHEARDHAMADLAAIVAYSVRASGDALWRHWTQQRLAEASALVALARHEHERLGGGELIRILEQISDVITGINASRPERTQIPVCSLDGVFVRLRSIYAQSEPTPTFKVTDVREVAIPEYLLRAVLMILVDNAVRAIRDSGVGSVIAVSALTDGPVCRIDVVDDGPGIPAELRAHVLQVPVASAAGQGVGLLYARGAALQYGGDLVLLSSACGTHFILTVPVKPPS